MHNVLVPIGCSGALAAVAFIVGLLASLLAQDVTWTERVTMAAMLAGMTFLAALLLAGRDTAKSSALMRSVRQHLLSCGDTSDDEFIASAPSDDQALLLETRKAVAGFFDVPVNRVRRDIHLINDLQVDKLEPAFQFAVVDSVIASQPVEPGSFTFSRRGLESIDDLTESIRKVLDGFDKAGDPSAS